MKLSRTVVLFAGAFGGLTAGAQAPDAGSSELSLEEVTVTARRREESLQITPVAVTAFSGEALEVRGAAQRRCALTVCAECAVRWRGGA